ncbi:MAG TPA: glycosyltransferase [Malonomonas sp.]
MTIVQSICLLSQVFSLLVCLSVLLLNPLWLLFNSRRKPPVPIPELTDAPSVSIITVVRNAEALIEAKVANTTSLTFPGEQNEILICSDASTDATLEKVMACKDDRVRIIASEVQQGKNRCLNQAIAASRGKILVFTDADALLQKDTLIRLLRHFADPAVGGVCGQRLITEKNHQLQSGQSDYIRFDSLIKMLESRQGSITSNDGKLFAIRRSLAPEIDPAVTDDFYLCLSVLEQRQKFVFEPEALAYIKLPSRSPEHEVARRRRIVTRSLHGLFLRRRLLNPLSFGDLAIRLLVNKLLRRLLPFFLLLLFFSSLGTAPLHPLFLLMFLAQVGLYLLAFCGHSCGLRVVRYLPGGERIVSALYYFCLGNLGSLLGVLDYLRGKRVDRWEPRKQDALR